MDKRYLLIIVITIFCCVNLYFISISSDIVGSASIDCGDYTMSIPAGFTLYEGNDQRVLIHNNENKMDIEVYTNLGKGSTYENKLGDIENSSEYKVLSKGNITLNGMNIDCFSYQRNKDGQNRSTFYFEKFDNDFRILIMNFDYNSDKNLTMQYVSDIITSLRLNYKNVKN